MSTRAWTNLIQYTWISPTAARDSGVVDPTLCSNRALDQYWTNRLPVSQNIRITMDWHHMLPLNH